MTRDEYGKAYEAGFPRTVQLLMALGTNRGDAEDLAQSAWARAWERLFQLRDDTNILGWVYAIGRNGLRSARRQRRFVQLNEIEEPLGRPMNGDAAIDAGHILEDCSAKDRQLLTQRYLLGCSGVEV